jgi:hypothetical protein
MPRVLAWHAGAMPDFPLTGGCLCGSVRYEVSEPLQSAGYCHCTRCQHRTGTAASPAALTARGSFRVTAGHDLIQDFDPGDGGFLKAYCAGCGGALFAVDKDDPLTLAVRMGTFDADPGIRPSYRQWTSSAPAWEPIPDDGLTRYEGRRPPGV